MDCVRISFDYDFGSNFSAIFRVSLRNTKILFAQRTGKLSPVTDQKVLLGTIRRTSNAREAYRLRTIVPGKKVNSFIKLSFNFIKN